MPRWCLFGRTRELCDKLESTGKAGQAKVKDQVQERHLNE